METIISTERTTKTDIKITIPFYTKVPLSTGGVYSMSKVYSEKNCIYVNSDSIRREHAGMAFNFPDWQEATKEEFEEFFKQTGQSLTDLAL